MNIFFIIYFSFGTFLSYINFSTSINFIYDLNYEKYKSQKFANGIRRIIHFNNIKFIANSLDFFLFFSLLYPLIFVVSKITKINTEYYLKKLAFFTIPCFIIGELPAYISKRKKRGKDIYHHIYTLNGKSKYYKNNKLHEDSKAWLIKEDNLIRPAITNVSFYHSHDGAKKFKFKHKERFFYEGKEIPRMLHSELIKKVTQNKINNF